MLSLMGSRLATKEPNPFTQNDWTKKIDITNINQLDNEIYGLNIPFQCVLFNTFI
jgi:hypothetical protein